MFFIDIFKNSKIYCRLFIRTCFKLSSRKFGKVGIAKECSVLILTLLLHLRHMYLSIELLPMPAGACTVMIVGILKFLTNQLSFLQGNKSSVYADRNSQKFFRTNPYSHQDPQIQICSTLIKLVGKN